MALKVTQTRSVIGTKPKQRGTLRALGLGRIGRANVLPDRPEIRGMIHRVPHLVRVEEVDESAAAKPDKAEKAEAPVKKATAKKATKKAAKKASGSATSGGGEGKAKKAAKKASGSATSGGGEGKAKKAAKKTAKKASSS